MQSSYTMIPYYFITKILRRKAKELAKYHTISLFGFDPEDNSITIFTDHPGYWLNRNGIGMIDLTNYINEKIEEHNHLLALAYEAGSIDALPEKIKPITLKLMQCDS